MTEAHDMARGYWRDILPKFGVDPKCLKNKHGPCPICGGKDRFRFDDKAGGGTYFCSQCGAGDGYNLALKVSKKSFREVADTVRQIVGERPKRVVSEKPRDDTANRNAMRSLWEAARPPREDGPVLPYLKNRLGFHFASNAIREHMSVWHPFEEKHLPAMLCKLAGADDRAANVHMTFLTMDGRKSPVEKTKLYMKGGLPDGCAVRLSPAAETMAIAEGVETAIAASILHDMPVWAATNADLLAKWVPPAIAKRVVVFGDNDESFTGQFRAYQLANRLKVQSKLDVDVRLPNKSGDDWADVLASLRTKP